MTSLDLGAKFNTSNVTDMSEMFAYCGHTAMTSLDLGDKFDVSKVKDMYKMFYSCGVTAMTSLDLGPAFTKIPTGTVTGEDDSSGAYEHSANEDFVTNCGTGTTTIYAPESIYSSRTGFKLSSTDTTTTIAYDRGTINPIYKPEWTKVSSALNTTNKTLAITVKGSSYKSQTIENTDVTINYASDVTSTLAAEDITVYIDGVDVTTYANPTVAVGAGSSATNSTSGKTEITHVITLSNFEEAVRQSGNSYKEWSGNVSIKIGGRGQATSTYTANVLTDSYGNQSMMATDETNGTWIDVEFKDGNVTANSSGTMFTDFIKPEFTYIDSDTVIDYDKATKKVTVTFDVTDKYFASTQLATDTNGELITVKIDSSEAANSALTKVLTKVSDIKETVNGVADTVIGATYKLEVTGFDQGEGFDYSGPMSLVFDAGIVTDKSNNSNAETTITIGIDEKDGNPGQDTAGTGTIVDLVDPVWITQNINIDKTNKKVTVDLIGKDKYYASNSLDTGDITVYIDGTAITSTTNVTKSLSTATLVKLDTNGNYVTATADDAIGVKYTLTLSDWKVDTRAAEAYREYSGTTKIEIAAATITDESSNTSNKQEFTLGHVDFLQPEIEKVSATRDATAKTETIIFNVMDKYLDTTDELTANDITVYVDKETASSVTKTLTKVKDFTETVNGASQVVGQQYQLVISGFEKDRTTITDDRKYKDWSGTVEIEIASGAMKDTSGNTNDEATIVGDFVDFIKPEVVYQYASSDIDYDAKTFTMVFDVRDKYFANSTLTIDNFETIITEIMVLEGDGNIMNDVNVKKSITAVETVYQETSMNKTVDGTVQTGLTNQVIGKRYTILLEDLEQDALTAVGNDYLNYSGVITVAIPEGMATDMGPAGDGTNPNGNAATTITSGVSIPGGSGTGTVVDVVDPIWQQVGTATAEPIRRKASIIISGTDKYIVSDTLTAADISVAVNGTVQDEDDGVTLTVTEDTSVSLAYGKQYIINVNGFVSDAHQVKLIFREGILTDESGNTSKETEFIIYSALRKTDTETLPTSPFLGEPTGTVERQKVEKIIFQHDLNGVNDTRWDVSAQEDGSIIAWYEETERGTYVVYIGGYTIKNGNPNSTNLFRYIGYDSACAVTGDTTASDDTAKPLIENLDYINFDNVTNMDSMFAYFGYSTMKSLDLGSNFDTSAVTNMSNMFVRCGYTAMTSLDLGDNFDTSKVTYMGSMFNNCGYTVMTSLDLGSKFNTSKVTDMSLMFFSCGYTAMTSLDLGDLFDTSSVTNMICMFDSCGQLSMTSLDLGDKFDTSNVTTMYKMFEQCGQQKLTSLDLGDKFDTSKVTDMYGMFGNCGAVAMTSLDLGDKFDTSKVTDMYGMFWNCGAVAMTSLDLGPLFTKIPTGTITAEDEEGNTSERSANGKFVTNAGKSDCIIYAPESIYENMKTFKLNSTSDTTIELDYSTQGTINPVYKPEWEKVSSTLDKNAGTMTLVVKGAANKVGTPVSGINYTSNVTHSVDPDKITVYIDNEKADSLGKVVSTATETTNATTGKTEVTYTITLSNFEETLRQVGKSYTEWSGNISVQLAKGTLVDIYGNQNLAEIDISITEDGTTTMDRIEIEDSTVSKNTDGTLFADLTKPEFTYKYMEADIDQTNKEVKVVFSVTDKYFESSSLTIDDLTILIDGETIDWSTNNGTDGKPTKTLTASTDDITATVNGTEKTIGKEYTLLLQNLEQTSIATGDNYLDYSGVITVAIAAGKVSDTSGNVNDEQTITMGINIPEGTGSEVIADVVDPLWEVENIQLVAGATPEQSKLTADLIITDKYFEGVSDSTLTTEAEKLQYIIDSITVTVDGAAPTTGYVTKSISSPTELKETRDGEEVIYGHKYTLTLSNWVDSTKTFTDTNSKTRQYREYSGTTEITISAGIMKDQYGNTNKVQSFDLGHVDFLKPEIEKVSSTSDATAKTETIIFTVMDKYLDSSEGNEITTDEIEVYVDGERADGNTDTTRNVTETLTYTEIKETRTVDGVSQDVVVGHEYTLVISDFEKLRESDGYEDWSGTVAIKVEAGAIQDTSENTNDETTLVGDFVDFITPDLEYLNQSSTTDVSDPTNKKYTMTFSITDKYYASGELTLADITNGNIEILMQNGQYQKDEDGNFVLDTDGNKIPIVYNLKDEPVTIALTSEEIRVASMPMTDTSDADAEYPDTIVTATNQLIGHKYTLTISNLEQLEIKTGLTTADYSGVITVAIPGSTNGTIVDTSGNKNDGHTITSGITIQAGATSGTEAEVDVVAPRWDRVSSSANSINQTGEITFNGTDTYFKQSTLTKDDIEVYVNGSLATGLTTSLTTATALNEQRLVSGTETSVQYGVQYKFTVSGFAQNVNQVKIKIPAGKLIDDSGNSNVATEMMVYNCLKVETDTISETMSDGTTWKHTQATSTFLGNTNIQRQDIENITFVSSLDDSTSDDVTQVWDVSAQGDGSIKAWTKQSAAPYTVYIGSDYEIFANRYSGYLFSYIGYSSACTATQAVTNLNLLNTSSVISMNQMFRYFGYTAMTSLDLGTFDTSNVIFMGSMFSHCGYTKMETFDIGDNFDTSKATNMSWMFPFVGVYKMTALDLGDKFDTSNVTDMAGMFHLTGEYNMTTLDLGDKFNTSNVTDMRQMFQGCGYMAMASLDLGDNFNTSNVTNMYAMFSSCGYTKMTSLDLGDNFDTSNVTNMSDMFRSCGYTAMTSLELGDKFDTSNVTSMSDMFRGCGYTALTSLDLGDKFYTTNVTNMIRMFRYCGVTAMTKLDLGPAFTKIPTGTVTVVDEDGNTVEKEANEEFITGCGTSNLVIYAPEAIYSNRTTFK